MNAVNRLEIQLAVTGQAASKAAFEALAATTATTNEAFRSLKDLGQALGDRVFPGAAAQALNASQAIQGMGQVARVLGLNLGTVSVVMAGVVAAAATGVASWKAYTAALGEAGSAAALWSQGWSLSGRLGKLVDESVLAGKISPEMGERLANTLLHPTSERIKLVQKALADLLPKADQLKAAAALGKLNVDLDIGGASAEDRANQEATKQFNARVAELDKELALFKNFTQLKSAFIDQGRAAELEGLTTIAEYRERERLKAEAEFQATMRQIAEKRAAEEKQLEARRQAEARQRAENADRLVGEISRSEMDSRGDKLGILQMEMADRERLVDQEIEDFETAQKLKLQIFQIYENKRFALIQEEVKKEIDEQKKSTEARIKLQNLILDTTAQIFGNMAQAAKAFGKEGFEVFRAMSYAEAVINGLKASIGAYQSAAQIPYVGWIIAPVAAAAAAAATAGQIAQIASTSYATGGFTGAGNPNEVAGLAHRSEFIFSAPAVQRIGLPNLEALHRGAPMQNASPAAAPVINQSFAILNDESQIPNWVRSQQGEAHIINVVRKNFHKLS